MIDLHYWTTPNGHKITICLEEMRLAYKIVPVDISKDEQFAPAFLAIAPNNKIPAMVDHAPLDPGAPLALVDVRVLDHFVVAGLQVHSFAEHGQL